MQELNALKTLKNPSHGGTSRRSVKLIGDGLLRFGQTGAQPMFGQPIDRASQSTMISPSATMRSGFLRNTEEARNKGSFKKRKPRSTPPWSFYVVTSSCSERMLSSRTLVATMKQALRRAS